VREGVGVGDFVALIDPVLFAELENAGVIDFWDVKVECIVAVTETFEEREPRALDELEPVKETIVLCDLSDVDVGEDDAATELVEFWIVGIDDIVDGIDGRLEEVAVMLNTLGELDMVTLTDAVKETVTVADCELLLELHAEILIEPETVSELDARGLNDADDDNDADWLLDDAAESDDNMEASALRVSMLRDWLALDETLHDA
jgi:hypothetical protein